MTTMTIDVSELQTLASKIDAIAEHIAGEYPDTRPGQCKCCGESADELRAEIENLKETLSEVAVSCEICPFCEVALPCPRGSHDKGCKLAEALEA